MILYVIKHPSENSYLYFNAKPYHWMKQLEYATFSRDKECLFYNQTNNLNFTREMCDGIISMISMHEITEETTTKEDIMEIFSQ